jgi:hypothetical protein
MKIRALIKYLSAVLEEAGDLEVIVAPKRPHSHILECPEVEDHAPYYVEKKIERMKAVVVK